MALHRLSTTELARRIREGELTSSEALEYFIARVEKLDPPLNAVVVRRFDEARQRAREADEALARGEHWGPLHGVPMTVKETFEVAGWPTTAGVTDLAGHVPRQDADAIERLRAAGAVLFGKTNIPAYAGDLQSFNEIYGTTNNPWNPELTPGGSSGGAAAGGSPGQG